LLPASCFKRPFVEFEIRTAVDLGKPIILVHETDTRHGAFDFATEKAATAADLQHLLDDIESIPFRRKSYERSAMLEFIVNKVRECSDLEVEDGPEDDAHEVNGQTGLRSASFSKWGENGLMVPSKDCGDLVFMGGRTDKKAKYVRLVANSDPGRVRTMLEGSWGLKRPEVLLSITGGATLSDIEPHMVSKLQQGLMEGAMKTGAWIVTGGTDNGAYSVMQLVGDAAEQYAHFDIPVLGVATWGCIAGRDQLLHEEQEARISLTASQKLDVGECARYQTTEELDAQSANLNLHHRYFILVDSGRDGEWGDEVELRSKIEHAICNPQDAWELRDRRAVAAATGLPAGEEGAADNSAAGAEGVKNHWAPLKPCMRKSYKSYPFKDMRAAPIHQVMISVGGGPNTLKTLLNAVQKESISVLVVAHSGRVSSLVAIAIDIIEQHMRKQWFKETAQCQSSEERLLMRRASSAKVAKMSVDDVCEQVLHVHMLAGVAQVLRGEVTADKVEGTDAQAGRSAGTLVVDFWQLLKQEFPDLKAQARRCREVVMVAMSKHVRVYRPSSKDEGDLAECIISSVKDAQTLEESIKLAVYWDLDGMFKTKGPNNLLSELSTLSEGHVSEALQTGLRCALEMNRPQFVQLFLTNGASLNAVDLMALYELGDIEESALSGRRGEASARQIVLRVFQKEFCRYLARQEQQEQQEEAEGGSFLMGSRSTLEGSTGAVVPRRQVSQNRSYSFKFSSAFKKDPGCSMQELLAWAILTHRMETVSVLICFAENRLSTLLLGFEIFKRLLPSAHCRDALFVCSTPRGGLLLSRGLQHDETQREFGLYQEMALAALAEQPTVPGFLAPNGLFDALVQVAKDEWYERRPSAEHRVKMISTPVMKAAVEQKWAAFGSRYYQASVVWWFFFIASYISFGMVAAGPYSYSQRSQPHRDNTELSLASLSMFLSIIHLAITARQFFSACCCTNVGHSGNTCYLSLKGVLTSFWGHALKLIDIAFAVCVIMVATQHMGQPAVERTTESTSRLPQWEREVMAASMVLAGGKSLLCLRGFERVGAFVQVLMAAMMQHLATFVFTVSIFISSHFLAIYFLFEESSHPSSEGAAGLLSLYYRILIGYYEQDGVYTDSDAAPAPLAVALLLVYSFTVVIVFLNLLIAVFNSSYQAWNARREEHQLLVRAAIILDVQLYLTPWQTHDPLLFPPYLSGVCRNNDAAGVHDHATPGALPRAANDRSLVSATSLTPSPLLVSLIIPLSFCLFVRRRGPRSKWRLQILLPPSVLLPDPRPMPPKRSTPSPTEWTCSRS
jgi:hypothetical protein